MTEVRRKDPYLQEALDLLDRRFEEAEADVDVAYASLSALELNFIDEEILKCLDFRYYAENYHIINSKHDGFMSLYPFWDSQEILYDKILKIQLAGRPVQVLILKARQLGISVLSQALLFHKTVFTEGINALIVAQDPDQADYLFDMSRNAYDSLPWWMRPESRYESKGRYIHFDRRDDLIRQTKPGLRSAIRVEAANSMTGVGVGKAINVCHMCLTARNPVIMRDGFLKSIADVRFGEDIRGRDGFVKVRATSIRAYDGLGLRVTTWCNSPFPIEGTDNHEVLAGTFNPRRKNLPRVHGIRLKRLDALTKMDSLIIPVRPITEYGAMPRVTDQVARKQGGGKKEKAIPNPPRPTKAWGFLIGLYLAEGSVTPTASGTVSQVCISLDMDEEVLAIRFAEACGIKYGKVTRNGDSRARIYHFYNSQLARWITDNIGIKDGKRIPDWCWSLGRDFLAGIAEGMILGDGHLTKKTPEIYFTSTRVQLAIQLREAILSLGHGYAGIYYREAGFHYGRNCQAAWILSFGKESAQSIRSEYGWIVLPDRRNNASHWTYLGNKTIMALRIKSIEKISPEIVYDVEVDSPDHIFSLPATLTHNSEISLWPAAKVLAEQLFPALSGAPGQFAVMESTARGRNNFWYDFWKDAWDGKVEWEPVFIEFFRVKKYSLPIPSNVPFERTKEEVALTEKIRETTSVELTNEQIYWRRKKMSEFSSLNRGDESKFWQEYPGASWLEAFQGSGICAFNKVRLQHVLESTCVPPLWHGEIDLKQSSSGIWNVPEYRLKKTIKGEKAPAAEQHGSRLYVWEQPDPNEKYFIGADVAHGVQGGDFSCAQVIRIGHGMRPDVQVAEWHGWINPTPYGNVVAALGYWYNTAEISLECNDVGLSSNAQLMRVLEYPNLFRWKHYDKITNFITNFTGWYTNTKTRDQIIAKFRESLDDETIIIRSEELVNECLDFSSEDDGRFEGQSTNDDRVFSVMIAIFCAHDMEAYGGEQPVQKVPSKKDTPRGVDFCNTEYSPLFDGKREHDSVPNEDKPPDDYALWEEVSPAGDEDLWRTI